MQADTNIQAHLVFDDNVLSVPANMGAAKANQLQGTPHENLSELCCRVCYDSLGKAKSRDSVQMHQHLLDVRHWSVYEHAHFTVEFPGESRNIDLWQGLANRPELFLMPISTTIDGALRVTLNYRHLLDWDKQTTIPEGQSIRALRTQLLMHGHTLAPRIIKREDWPAADQMKSQRVQPVFEQEKFVTIFLSSSRGASHEQVRHRYNISQRSSRFCDECDSDWVTHPLVSKFLQDETLPPESRDWMSLNGMNCSSPWMVA